MAETALAKGSKAGAKNGATSKEDVVRQVLDQMVNTLLGAEKVEVSNVTRYDGPGIQVPEGMELAAAIKILQRKDREENETINVSATIPAFPYEGAYALSLALKEMFGYVISARCACGQNHNQDLSLEIDKHGNTVTVPWGSFHVPNITGEVMTDFSYNGKTFIFQITGSIKGRDKRRFDALVEKTKQIVREKSIYRGKVLRVQFTNDQDRRLPIPEIKFVNVDEAQCPIFSDGLQEQLDNDVLSYITHADLMKKLNGGKLKRGVLLAGPYGTGKTLTAAWAAKLAEAAGFTFFYVNKPSEFQDAYRLAQAYQPAAVFMEDVDALIGLDRTDQVNSLLNILDGADTKNDDIVVFFTTNHGERINAAMKRPGRLDVIMLVEPPDAVASIRLARYYSSNQMEGSDEDFTEAGLKLAGRIPADIKEAVTRARVRAVVRTGNDNATIIGPDLVRAADSITRERTAFKENDPTEIQKLGTKVGSEVLKMTRALVTTGSTNFVDQDADL